MKHLPQFVRDLLSSPPRHGEGVHQYIYRVARVLHPYRDESEIVDTLRALTDGCGRHVAEKEILVAVQNSKAHAWQPGQARSESSPRWPSINIEQREAVIASGYGLVDLWEDSPFRPDESMTPNELLKILFPGDPLLCLARRHPADAKTQLLSQWLQTPDLKSFALVVPSPMTSVFGTAQDGKESQRCLNNTGVRRFLVVEFDPCKWENLTEEEKKPFASEEQYYEVKRDEQAAVLIHLAEHAPLVLALHSGGKSLQGWFYCNSRPEAALKRFMSYAVSLGADTATWTRCQLIRLPDGTRDNGKKQTVYFFNPEAMQ